MSLADNVNTILGVNGQIADKIEGYEVRQAQLNMSRAVSEIIEQKGALLAEAGTGTGKTFAYLIPALLSGKKVIVSTATKTLQEQLISKDVPFLVDVCQVSGQARLLKGRENYLCPQRLEMAETSEQHPKDVWKKLDQIHEWSLKTKIGDRTELSTLDEHDPVWSKVCARMEFCQANTCSGEDSCFYPKVKEAAHEAQLLIVNHHLFCADLALREQGFGEVLPEADIYIFDEAHQLPDIAAQFLGFNVSRYQLDELVRDIRQAYKQEAPDVKTLNEQASLIESGVLKFNESLGKWEKRWNWDSFNASKTNRKTLEHLRNQLTTVAETLKSLTDRGKLLAALYKRVQGFESQLSLWLSSESENHIRWVESSQARFKLNLTPLNVSDVFSRQRDQLGGSWVFTSATLSVAGNFDYFAQRLGLQDSEQQSWPSPFDYGKQGVIYHPLGLPDPKHPDYIKICLRAAWPLLQTSEGRAFLLFTSHRALQEAKNILNEHWHGTLWVQGDLPKNVLLEKFKSSEKAILLGTSSFWEGVDVKGEALKLVLIDRIPFIPPDDPLVQARESFLKQKGLNGFFHFQLPEAIMALKQGSGRLIRDTSDTGVLILCDPRLSQKGYGKMITQSLPPFEWVYNVEAAKEKLL